MGFTADELLEWAGRHEGDEWTTLARRLPFRFRVTRSGIEYVPGSGRRRNVPRGEIESFCVQFRETRSFAPGQYPNRWHKSYTLPLIQRFLAERREPGADAAARR
jgi:hypothetical protein